ncbi:TPA: hca cluster transcriptional activator, partial [Acinetobacter baumannii]|nr:RpiR family transcriptional regulator [Acinetobacter baumannii]HAV4427686.1 hca cluster transcriptional activator [Acinetobacter baumannii]
LHNTILEFTKTHGIDLNIVQKADSILLNINSIGSGLGCTILPAYVAPLGVSNTVVRPLDVELPSLDLFVSYRKNTESVGVKRFIDQLNKVFHLDKNLD